MIAYAASALLAAALIVGGGWVLRAGMDLASRAIDHREHTRG